jgi:hypothetical protein
MPNPRLIVRVQTKNLRAEVWVNGAPVAMLFPGEADTPVAVPVNEFAVTGGNVVGIMLHAAPRPSAAGEPWASDGEAASYTGPASLSVRVAQYGPSESVAAGNPAPLATLDWQGMAAPLPAMAERRFNVDYAYGPWAWQSAQRYDSFDRVLRARAFDYLAYLHGLLAAGRIAEFVEANKLRLEEITARAYGISPQPLRRTLTRAIEQHASNEEWSLSPLDPREIDLRLVAGGRMIECLRTNRHHALEFTRKESPETFFLPAMIGVLGDSWQILR